MWLGDSWIIWLTLSLCLWRCTTAESVQREEGVVCQTDMFRCGVELVQGKPCIPQSWVCDGEEDCPDGSDEKQNCPPTRCPADKFQCKGSKICIPRGWLCDQEKDCLDGSDETISVCRTYKKKYPSNNMTGPDVQFKCEPNMYNCDGTMKCIFLKQICDGRIDCDDATDEGLHCRSKACKDHSCAPTASCRMTRQGPICVCNNQYQFLNGSVCQDLNLCEYDRYCDQTCTDLGGGKVKCSCVEGYKNTTSNSSRCAAINEPEGARGMLLFTNTPEILGKDEIQQLYLDGTELQNRIRYPATETSVMDYDFKNSTMCYVHVSVESNKAVMRCAKISASGDAKKKKVPTATLR